MPKRPANEPLYAPTRLNPDERSGKRTNRQHHFCAGRSPRRNRLRPAVIAHMHEGEGRVGDLVAMVRLETLRPGLDVDLHRGAADALDLGIDLEHVADAHRLDESHRIDLDGHD